MYTINSKPNTVACSTFEFPFYCQKDTEAAMRLCIGFTLDLTGLICILIWVCFHYMFAINFYRRSSKIILRDKQSESRIKIRVNFKISLSG